MKAPCWYCEGTVWISKDQATCDDCGEEYSPEEFNKEGSRNLDPFPEEKERGITIVTTNTVEDNLEALLKNA